MKHLKQIEKEQIFPPQNCYTKYQSRGSKVVKCKKSSSNPTCSHKFIFIIINVFIGSVHLYKSKFEKRPEMPIVLQTAWTHVLSAIVIAIDHNIKS